MSKLKYPTPQLLFNGICDAIREKTGSTDKIPHQNIPDSIDNILTEEECEIAAQELSNIIFGSEVKVLDSKYILNIANYKFYNNNNLTTINLPKCTFIGDRAFNHCINLTTVNLPKCTFVKDVAFAHCTNLTTINLPKCTFVKDVAFAHCTNLTTINLPKCTSIENQVFNDCTSLTTINLPECTSIGNYAFSSCTNLTTVIFGADQEVHIYINVFDNSPIENGTGYIYVPDNLVDSYKTDTNWSNYANQIKPLSELPSELKEEYGYD